MPIDWAQVKTGLDPSRYTVRSIPRRIAKLTARADYRAGGRPLGPAIKRLGRV